MTETEARVREMLAESDIDGEGLDELFACLVGLECYVDETVPEPSPELAALMAGLASNVVAIPLRRRRGRLFIAGAAAFGTVAAGGIAAAANELPPAAQTIVAEFSEEFLPFELPRPEEDTLPGDETPDEPFVNTDGQGSQEGGGGPVATPESSQSPDADSPTPSSTAPTPTVEDTPSTPPSLEPEPTVPPTDPSVAPDPSEVPTDGVTEDPQAGESPSSDPSSGTSDPSGSPSESGSPSPTANTRNEATDDPSGTASSSPSGSGSGSGSDSPSGSASSSEVWTDE